MASITVRCSTCRHTMKFSAEKEGKRAKCPKCDAIIVIKPEEEPAPVAAAPEEAAAAVEAPAPSAEDEDSKGGYGVYLDPEIEERRKALAEEEARKAKDKKRKKLPKVGRKIKAIPDADAWKKVRLGMIFITLGCIVWLVTHILQGSFLLIGSTEFAEYAALIDGHLAIRGGDGALPERGRFWDINELGVHLGMVAGRDFTGYARLCMTLGALLYFLQAMFFGLGYLFYLPAPRRFGMFGQSIIAVALVFFNFVFMFAFKILPVLGVHRYVLIPFVIPEIVMTEYNMERTVPIHLMWAGAGWGALFEQLLNLFLRFLQYMEPAMGCIFLWSAGVTVKDDDLAERGKGLTQMCLGTAFVLLCFHMLSLCGASPVLVIVLRVVYGLWFGFVIMFTASYAMGLLKFRSVLAEKIWPANELKEDRDDDEDEEDEDEDEEDEEEKPRRRKRKE